MVITFDNQTSEGLVVLASANGRSLMLAFESMLGGYVGLMPVLWVEEPMIVRLRSKGGGEFRDLIQQRRVEITYLPPPTSTGGPLGIR